MNSRHASVRVLSAAALLACSGLALAGIQLDVEKELRLLERGERVPLHISGAKYRVAAFTYEDPDETHLGNDLAAIVSREILLGSKVSSIGVLRYQGELAPSATDTLSYFDKVEKLTAHQETVLAVWGVVRREGEQLRVDTYVQIPLAVAQRSLSWRMTLPKAMGGAELRGRVGPDRILIQSLALPVEATRALHESARALDELRATAAADAPVIGTIPQADVYWFGERRGEWIFVNTSSGLKGWVRTAADCAGACARLLEAAHFGAGVLRYLADAEAPAVTDSLAPDARVFRAQLTAAAAFDRPESFDYPKFIASAADNPAAQATPGGASLANLRAVVRLALALYTERVRPGPEGDGDRVRIPYDFQKLAPAFVRDVAFELAEASQRDPRNLDVLHNLEVLFRYAGDEQRAEAARAIAAGIAAR